MIESVFFENQIGDGSSGIKPILQQILRILVCSQRFILPEPRINDTVQQNRTLILLDHILLVVVTDAFNCISTIAIDLLRSVIMIRNRQDKVGEISVSGIDMYFNCPNFYTIYKYTPMVLISEICPMIFHFFSQLFGQSASHLVQYFPEFRTMIHLLRMA